MSSSAQTGRIVAGELDVEFFPHGGCHGKRPVFLFHGQLRTASDWTDTAAWPGSARLARALQASGLLVIAAHWKGPAWGDQAFRDAVEVARTYAVSRGAAADKFVAIGASMGAFESLSLAQHVPNEVACAVGLIPAIDLDAFRDGDIANAQAPINAAFNLTAGSTSATVPLPTDANVFKDANAAQITCPVKLYGSSTDAFASWATAQAFAAKIGAQAVDVLPDGGHTDATIKAAPVDEIVAFVASHA